MKCLLLIGIFLSSTLLCTHGSPLEEITTLLLKTNENTGNLTVLEKWQGFEKGVKKIVSAGFKMLLPLVMKNQRKVNISSQCMAQCIKLIGGLKNIKPWAIRFIDSSAKMLDGLLTGSLSNFGEYDECVDTVVTSDKPRDKGKVLFQGQYCSINIKLPLPPKRNFYKLDETLDELKNFSEGGNVINEAAKLAHFFYFLSLRMGICVPSGCTVEDIDQITRQIGGSLPLEIGVSRCEIKQKAEYTPIRIFVICAYSFAGLLLAIGSLIDLYAYYGKVSFRSTAIKVLLAFSIISNFKKFSNTKTSSETLSCLNGIRFLCMTWIILGHTYFIVNYQMLHGFTKAKDFARDFAFQAITNASVAVDTFFCIGGLLVCYVTIKLVKIGGNPFNIKLYIFHRLWRILPVYMFVILFMFLGPILGDGPIWYETTNMYFEPCENYWWTNIIFINNFYNAENICVPQSWYIACDFQMYIAALLILIPLLRWPKVGLSLCIVAIMASVIYGGVGTYIHDYPPTMLFAHPDPNQRISYWAHFYFLPFVHVSPYAIGLIAGYILAMYPDMKIPRVVQLLGWSLAFIFNFSVLYGVVQWNRGVEPTFWGGLLYASFNRTAWTLGIAWMIICCATGHGGVINYILSLKAFVPLGRLTFLAYLIHTIVQIAFMGNIRTQIQADHTMAVWFFFGHLCITYSAAFAGSMLIESPLMALEKIMFGKSDDKKTDDVSPRKNSVPNGSLKTGKNGDIAIKVPKDDRETCGIDNKAIVYKL